MDQETSSAVESPSVPASGLAPGLTAIVERHAELAGLGRQALAATAPPPLLSDEQDFEQEIRRFGSLEPVDWAIVETLAIRLAARKRDLKVFNYLCLAVFYSRKDRRPYAPLAAVLLAYRDLIVGGWDTCRPSAARRADSLNWLGKKLAEAVETQAPQKDEAAEFRAFADAAQILGDAIGAALEQGRPGLFELRTVIKKYLQMLPAELSEREPPIPFVHPPVQVTEAAVPTPVLAPTVPVVAPTVGVAAPETSENLDEKIRQAVIRRAAEMRATDPADPAPYWMLRAVMWSQHELLRGDGYQTAITNKYQALLPRPEGYLQLVKSIPEGIATKRYAEVANDCEELFCTYPLWLDLQRWVVSCLDALSLFEARRAVVYELSQLLSRFPELLRFKWNGGGFLASEETTRWFQSELAGTPQKNAESPVEKAPTPAGLRPGLLHFQGRLDQAAVARERFLIRLEMARVCLAERRADLAAPLLDSLLHESETLHLEEWEPALPAEALRLRLQAARLAQEDAAVRIRLWSRLCQFSPAEAEALGPETP